MRRRGALAALAACAALACIDTSGPKSGALSIAAIRLPSPSIVVGDVMRDSAGNPTPIVDTAFDASGHPITDSPATFVITTRGMHLNADNVLAGDSISTAAVVAQAGGLQSQPATVAITFPPDSAFATSPDTLRVVTTSDKLRSSNLTVTLIGQNRLGPAAGAGKGGAQGFVIHYAITHAPLSAKQDSATAYLSDGTRASANDTTDATGAASRQAVLILHLLGDPNLLSGASTDSIVVEATVNARGATVLPSNVVRFVIPVSK